MNRRKRNTSCRHRLPGAECTPTKLPREKKSLESASVVCVDSGDTTCPGRPRNGEGRLWLAPIVARAECANLGDVVLAVPAVQGSELFERNVPARRVDESA